jgi:hypothetical protein
LDDRTALPPSPAAPSGALSDPRPRSEERGRRSSCASSSSARASADRDLASERDVPLRASRRAYVEHDATVPDVEARRTKTGSPLRTEARVGGRHFDLSTSPTPRPRRRPTSALRGARRSSEASSQRPRRAPPRAVGRKKRPEERSLPASSSRRDPEGILIEPRPDLRPPKTASIRSWDDSEPASGWSGHHARQKRGKARRRTTLPWGFAPFDVSDASSDRCRDCLTRLGSASRLSQPLDALLRSHPYGLVSCRIRPWGFGLQRFPPPARRHDFRRALPLLPFAAPRRGRLQGLVLAGGPFAPGRCYPGPSGRSSLGCFTLSRGLYPSSLGFASLQSLLSWAFHNAG